MGLFGKRSAPSRRGSLVAGELNRIVAYGRFELAPQDNDPGAFGMLEPDLYPVASGNPSQFCADLAQLVLPHGGVAAYGGARLAGSLLGWDYDDPNYWAMVDVGIEWRRALGATPAQLAPFEMQRWRETRGAW